MCVFFGGPPKWLRFCSWLSLVFLLTPNHGSSPAQMAAGPTARCLLLSQGSAARLRGLRSERGAAGVVGALAQASPGGRKRCGETTEENKQLGPAS